MKYFSYNPEYGFFIHNTAEDAKKTAEEWLDFEREEAHEGWCDYIDGICWGEVKQQVVEIMCRPRTDEDNFVSSCCDTIADYGLINT